MALNLGNLSMPGKQTVRDDMGAMRLIQAAQQAPQGLTPKVQQVNQMTAALEAPKQEERVTEAKDTAEQRLAQGQLQLKEQALQSQEKLVQKELALQQTDRKIRERLNTMSSTEYNRLFNETMQFKRDELGRTQWNEHQLTDWAVTKAKTDEDLQNYEMIVGHAYERKAQIKEHAFNLILQDMQQKSDKKLQQLEQATTRAEQALDQQFKIAQQQQNFEAQKAIEQKRAELKARLQKEINAASSEMNRLEQEMKKQANKDKADANNTLAIFTTGGTILGGLAGAATGTPAGAAIGASLGGGLGSLAGSQLT